MGSKLVAATFGRGMFFTTPISESVRPVDLTVSSVSVSGGNGNGAVDPNECNQINVVIQNSGETIAYDVTAEHRSRRQA